MKTIYTDGAYRRSTGDGGWAYIVLDDNDQEIARGSGAASSTTQNRMELVAACEALDAHPDGSLHVCVDSTYVFNGVSTHVWHWRENGWLTKSRRKPVANQDLWERLVTALQTCEVEPTWERIPGHSGDFWNEQCDRLAVAESRTRSTGL